MSKISLSSNILKDFFITEAAQIETNADTISTIKSRMNSRANKKRKISFSNYNIYRPKKVLAAVICCLLVMASVSVFFIAPVRAFAQDTFNNFKSIVITVPEANDGNYTVIQNADGYYSVTQNSEKDAIKCKKARSIPTKQTLLSEAELSKEVGYQVKIPDSLEGGYLLNYKAFGPIYEAPSVKKIENISESTVRVTFNDAKKEITPDNEVAAIFDKATDSRLVLIINSSEKADPFMYEKDLRTNEKSQEVSGLTTQYYEMPNVEYPSKEAVNSNPSPDTTKKPASVGTSSILTWCDQGVFYYLVHDNSSYTITFDVLKAAAESIIKH